MAEPIRMPKKPERNEIATTEKDIDIFAGWIKRLENPDPVLRTEARGKGLKLYDEVARDPHAGAVLQTRYLSVVGKEWQIEPAEGTPSRGRPAAQSMEQKIADYVEQVLYNINFDQARQELLQGILYGFYVWEVMWDYSEGQVWIDRLIAKHPRRFIFTPERELRLLTPQAMIDGEPVPDRKFVVFTYGSTDNPYGCGLGQKLWWPVWFKKHGIKFWVIFAEKFGSPTVVGKYPPGTTKDDQDKLLDAVEAIQQEAGIVVPENMLIDLLEASRTSSIDTYEALCEYMDRQISKAVLGQTLTTEVGDKGSYAAGRVHEEVRQDILKADADLLCECLNRTLVRWIVDFNFPDVRGYPKIWIRTEEEKDLKPLAERDKILVKEIGLPVAEGYFYDMYNVPRPAEHEALVAPPTGGPKGSDLGMEYQEKDTPRTRPDPGQAAIDELVSALGGDEGALDPMLGPVLELVKKASSYEEILEGLYELYPQMDTGQFEKLLGKAMFAADLWGYLRSREEISGG